MKCLVMTAMIGAMGIVTKGLKGYEKQQQESIQ
jgi:hypothetical protein